jgi:hypothetical protein
LQVASTGLSTSGYVLTSNGAAALPSFQAAPGSTGITKVAIQTFVYTGSGQTYTPTTNMKYCIIQCLGGGGAGGGAASTPTNQYSASTGGGAGEYAVGVFSAATVGADQSVTIGAGGTGASGTTGGNGGNTSVGALISAYGGVGGTSSAAYSNTSAVGIAGVLGGTGGSGGSYRTPGNPSPGSYNYYYLTYPQGANSLLGAGGNTTAFNATGTAALGYGSGGGGAANTASQVAHTGGAGAPGIVIITEYI